MGTTLRGLFHVESPSGERWEVALELLRSGKAIAFAEVGLRLISNDELGVIVPSAWSDLSNITEQRALRDLDRARSVVHDLIEADTEFARLVGDRRVTYELVIDDELGSLLICTTADGGAIEWRTG